MTSRDHSCVLLCPEEADEQVDKLIGTLAPYQSAGIKLDVALPGIMDINMLQPKKKTLLGHNKGDGPGGGGWW